MNDFWLGETSSFPSGDPLSWDISYLGTDNENKIDGYYLPGWDCHGVVKYQQEKPAVTEGRSLGTGDLKSCLYGPITLSWTRVVGTLDFKSKSKILKLMKKVVVNKEKQA